MSKGNEKKKLAWDLDGTLFDTWSVHCEAIREAYRAVFHGDISMATLICAQKACLTDTIRTVFGESCVEALLLYQRAFQKLVAENKLEDKIHAYDQLCELADQGYEMCLITGRDAETTGSILKHFSIDSFFQKIYSVNEYGTSKEWILKQYADKWKDYEYITDSLKEAHEYAEYFSDIHLVKWFSKC